MKRFVHIVSANDARLHEGHVEALCGVVMAEEDYQNLWVMSEVRATCRTCLAAFEVRVERARRGA
jgi:hypothetical protein